MKVLGDTVVSTIDFPITVALRVVLVAACWLVVLPFCVLNLNPWPAMICFHSVVIVVSRSGQAQQHQSQAAMSTVQRVFPFKTMAAAQDEVSIILLYACTGSYIST